MQRSLRAIAILGPVAILGSLPAAEAPADLKKLFDDYAGKDSDEAEEALVALGDRAVPFLAEVIRAKEPHLRRFRTVDGPQEVMGTWSQEAASILMRIDTPLVVEEARKLAAHEDEEVRFWGIWTLKCCKLERERSIEFLRSRVEAETGRNRAEIIEMLGDRRDPKDAPLFRKLASVERDLHVRLALLYAMARQGDKEALLEIVKICGTEGGDLGVVYLEKATGKDFGWEKDVWRDWLGKTSPEEIKRVTDRASRPAEVREGGWEEFLEAVTRLQEEGDRAKAARLFRGVAVRFPDSDYAEDSSELAGLLERMAGEDRIRKDPPDLETSGLEERIRCLVYHLRDVECYQRSQPGYCDLLAGCGRFGDGPNPAVELAKMGEAAVPALLDLLEDRRPTRSVGYWRDFGKSRRVLRYQDVAVRILSGLAKVPFYARRTTSAYFSAEEPRERRAVIEALRAWFDEGKGKGPAEKKWLVYRKSDFHPAGLALLRSIAVDDGKKDDVLAELRRAYSEAHWAYRPLIAELMADLGDRGKVAEVLREKARYIKRFPGTKQLIDARLAGEAALERLEKKRGVVPVMVPLIASLTFLTAPLAAGDPPPAPAAPAALPDIRAFCIDFNWGPGLPSGFAAPGVWADASPEEHVAWYEALGCNVIQTFAVSCNGRAWYKGGIVPEQPGLKRDFLTEVVRLGHARGMKVMGYFCAGANTLWAERHPDLSYGAPGTPHIPFTAEYLAYLAASIDDALRKTGMDGFMVDWMWNPGDLGPAPLRWLPCEQAMWIELMGEAFPGKEAVTKEKDLEFRRKAIDRCWERIRRAAKAARPDCTIWLSCCDVRSPAVAGSRLFLEVDWLMNEATDPAALSAVEKMKGPRTRLVQCVVGWGDAHDARRIVTSPAARGFGIYGFAKPGESSLPLPVAEYRSRPIASFSGNDRNIAVLSRFFKGLDLDTAVPAGPGGGFVLGPGTAIPRGPSPVVMDGQIGHWGNPADSVEWTIDLEKARRFAVTIEYAVEKGMGGSRFALRAGGRELEMESVETGTWRDYRTFPVGTISLDRPGRHIIAVVPAAGGPWKAISLRAVRLAPVRD